MALSSNPTRTRTIEANWRREINRRWRQFTRIMVDALTTANDNPNGSNFPLINKGAIFALSPSKQRTFMQFMELQIDRLLLGTDAAPNWQAQYQLQSYQRGVESARRHLLAQSSTLARTAEEVAEAALLGDFTAIPSLGASATVTAPIHQDALEFLFTRSYDKLNGWTDAMATETRQILFDGVSQGKGIDETVREMVKRIDVSRSRARVIARTETIQAFQQSNTNEAERASEEIGEVILLRWLTARDDRVRHLHATWHGSLATTKENRVRIGISPQNCRCAVAPVIPEANTKAKQKKFDLERKQLLKLELKGKRGVIPKAKPKTEPKAAPKAAPKKKKPAKQKPAPRPIGFNDSDANSMAWVNSSLDNRVYRNILPKVPMASTVNEGGGAWYQFDVINMGKKTQTLADHRAVYRHEFGHHVDASKSNYSGTNEKYLKARFDDSKSIADITKKLVKDYKNEGVTSRRRGSNFAIDAFRQKVRDTTGDVDTSGGLPSVKAWGEKNLPKTGLARDLFNDLEWIEPTGDRIKQIAVDTQARYVAALKEVASKNNNPLLAAQSSWDFQPFSNRLPKEYNQVSDLVNATAGKWGGGHTASYYKQRFQGENKEAFAQVFALSDPVSPAATRKMAELLTPNQVKVMEALLNE